METSRAFAARAARGERASSRDALEDDDAWRANAVEDFERVRREGRARARANGGERGGSVVEMMTMIFLVFSETRARTTTTSRGRRAWCAGGGREGRRPGGRPSVVGEG